MLEVQGLLRLWRLRHQPGLPRAAPHPWPRPLSAAR